MLLPKTIDSIVLATATPKHTRERLSTYALDHVRITENKIAATNKRACYWANIEKINELSDEYPLNEEIKEQPITSFPALLPSIAIEKAIKNRPRKPVMSILENIHLTEGQNSTESRRVFNLQTTDLDTFDNVSVKSNCTDFPNIDSIKNSLPSLEEACHFSISVENLELLLKIAKKEKAYAVDFSAWDEISAPISVSVGDVAGIIMPVQK